MADGHEGEDVCANFLLCQVMARFCIAGANKQHQNVMRWTERIPFGILLACCNHVIDRLIEKSHSGAGVEAADARNKFRKIEKIEGVDPAQRIEEGAHGCAQIVPPNREAARKDSGAAGAPAVKPCSVCYAALADPSFSEAKRVPSTRALIF